VSGEWVKNKVALYGVLSTEYKVLVMFEFLFKGRRRQKLLDALLPDEWLQIIESKVAVYSRLSAEQQQRLIQAVKVIAAERPFVGCQGLEVSDEVKVTIAAQAALLLLGEEGYYFDRVPTIFVYPRHQLARTVHDLTHAHLVEEDVPIDGQALEQGEIRLAWNEVLYGASDPADGENVVLHEFAHHLDRLDGEMGGTPPLASHQQREQWVAVFERELDELRREQDRGSETFLHEEAAESRAELFAYSTECFFEQPHELEQWHPELFGCLLSFYKTDPREWFVR
jgi:Mlc titration factor MtfA (ptsG expression regulator)